MSTRLYLATAGPGQVLTDADAAMLVGKHPTLKATSVTTDGVSVEETPLVIVAARVVNDGTAILLTLEEA